MNERKKYVFVNVSLEIVACFRSGMLKRLNKNTESHCARIWMNGKESREHQMRCDKSVLGISTWIRMYWYTCALKHQKQNLYRSRLPQQTSESMRERKKMLQKQFQLVIINMLLFWLYSAVAILLIHHWIPYFSTDFFRALFIYLKLTIWQTVFQTIHEYITKWT